MRKDNFEHPEAGDEQSQDRDTDDSDASLACRGDRYCSENERCDTGHVRGEKGDGEPEIVKELLATSLTGGDQENERREEAGEGRYRKYRPAAGAGRWGQHDKSLAVADGARAGANVLPSEMIAPLKSPPLLAQGTISRARCRPVPGSGGPSSG